MSCQLTGNLHFPLGKLRDKQSCFPERCQVILCQKYAFLSRTEKNVKFCNACLNSEAITGVTCFRTKLPQSGDCQRRQWLSHQTGKKQGKKKDVKTLLCCSGCLSLGSGLARGWCWSNNYWSCVGCKAFGTTILSGEIVSQMCDLNPEFLLIVTQSNRPVISEQLPQQTKTAELMTKHYFH